MGQPQVNLATVYTQIDCGSCGGVYAINERYRQHCQDYGRSWHCPYCQTGWGFAGKGELKQEQERHQNTLSRLNALQTEKDAIERKLKRVNRGVCPHCNRSFQNLARHMKCKHAD